MGIGKILISLLVFQFCCLALYSQEPPKVAVILEYKHKLNKTSHLNAPVSINTYFEGGHILNQYGKWTNDSDFYLSLRTQKLLEYRIGMGLTSIRFDQVREGWTGIGPDFYEVVYETVEYDLVNLQIGIRKFCNSAGKLKPFGGLSFIGEENLEDDFQIKYGFSIEAEIGLEYSFGERILTGMNLMYRNAILAYNRNKNYYPRLWGVGLSLKYKLNKQRRMPASEK